MVEPALAFRWACAIWPCLVNKPACAFELGFEATSNLAEHPNHPPFTTALRAELIEIRGQLTRMQEEVHSSLATDPQFAEVSPKAIGEPGPSCTISSPEFDAPISPLETLQHLLARSQGSQHR